MKNSNVALLLIAVTGVLCFLFSSSAETGLLRERSYARVLDDTFSSGVPSRGKSPPALKPLPITDPKALAELNEKRKREGYGGAGDASHVGGFTTNDTHSYEPWLWDFMVDNMGVKSVIDVGCGRGISTRWFLDRGTDVLCVEGSSDAIANSLLPRDNIVQHDFSRGPWYCSWPDAKIYDAAWSVEVLEHVEREYHDNIMATFKSARYLFVTHSVWGGWHHVEVHNDWWWIERFRYYGFEYAPELTALARSLCTEPAGEWGSNRSNTHFGFHGLVFRNVPLLAAHMPSGTGDYEEQKVISEQPNKSHHKWGGAMTQRWENFAKQFRPVREGIVWN